MRIKRWHILAFIGFLILFLGTALISQISVRNNTQELAQINYKYQKDWRGAKNNMDSAFRVGATIVEDYKNITGNQADYDEFYKIRGKYNDVINKKEQFTQYKKMITLAKGTLKSYNSAERKKSKLYTIQKNNLEMIDKSVNAQIDDYNQEIKKYNKILDVPFKKLWYPKLTMQAEL